MKAGISIYIGLDNSLEENLQLIQNAAAWRIKSIFTSFQIPETNMEVFKEEVQTTFNLAKKLGFNIISDISPSTIKLLGANTIDYASIMRIGIETIRLDDGFSVSDMSSLSRNPYGMKIQINASTCTEADLIKLQESNAKFSNITALHNFYPRENTGLSEKFFLEKNALLHKYGIAVAAFVPSMNKPRSPIRAGLPTLEEHRYCSFDFAVRHLISMGVDEIFIGDSMPTEEELKLLSLLPSHQVNFRADIITENSAVQALLRQSFHTRPDEARDVFRSAESRTFCKKNKIKINPENTTERKYGSITLDNIGYQRYAGELQILRCDLPADERVNVVARLNEQEQKLMQYLTPNTAFQII